MFFYNPNGDETVVDVNPVKRYYTRNMYIHILYMDINAMERGVQPKCVNEIRTDSFSYSSHLLH